MESPVGALSSISLRDTKKAGNSELLLGVSCSFRLGLTEGRGWSRGHQASRLRAPTPSLLVLKVGPQ